MDHRLTASQWTLLSSAILYPFTLYFSIPESVTPARFAQSRETISVFHCSLMTALSILCLQKSSASNLLSLGSTAKPLATNLQSPVPESDADLPIITYQSEFANSITALETGYLLQDSFILLWADRLHRRSRAAGLKPLKGLNIRHLALHHSFLVCALGVLQWYIARGKEKGILVIIMMFLMNASSPVGAIRWYLVNFRSGYRQAITAVTVAYLAMYGLCRVYLIYYILKVFGAQQGQSAMQAFTRLRTPCKLGTSAIGVVNSAWLMMGILRFLIRDLRFGSRTRMKR